MFVKLSLQLRNLNHIFRSKYDDRLASPKKLFLQGGVSQNPPTDSGRNQPAEGKRETAYLKLHGGTVTRTTSSTKNAKQDIEPPKENTCNDVENIKNEAEKS